MPPELVEVKRWLVKAEHDRSVAKKLFDAHCEETDIAAFHCQQSVEKLLKAYLVFRQIRFGKIHDIRRLLDQCTGADAKFETLREAAEPLSLFATTFRYPGPADPSLVQVESALRAVESVWEFVKSKLPAEVLT